MIFLYPSLILLEFLKKFELTMYQINVPIIVVNEHEKIFKTTSRLDYHGTT